MKKRTPRVAESYPHLPADLPSSHSKNLQTRNPTHHRQPMPDNGLEIKDNGQYQAK